MTLIRSRALGTSDHEVFLVLYPETTVPFFAPPVPGAQAVSRSSTPAVSEPALPRRRSSRDSFTSSRRSTDVRSSEEGARATQSREFYMRNFPFHLLLDTQGGVVQAGVTLTRMEPRLVPGAIAGLLIEAVAPFHGPVVVQPESLLEACESDCLLLRLGCGLQLKGTFIPSGFSDDLVVRPQRKPHRHTMQGGASTGSLAAARESPGPAPRTPSVFSALPALLRGSAHDVSSSFSAQQQLDTGCVVFLGSPFLKPNQKLADFGLSIADLPLYDQSRDFVMVSEQRKALAERKERLEMDREARTELETLIESLEQSRNEEREVLRIVVSGLCRLATTPLCGCAAAAFAAEELDRGAHRAGARGVMESGVPVSRVFIFFYKTNPRPRPSLHWASPPQACKSRAAWSTQSRAAEHPPSRPDSSQGNLGAWLCLSVLALHPEALTSARRRPQSRPTRWASPL